MKASNEMSNEMVNALLHEQLDVAKQKIEMLTRQLENANLRLKVVTETFSAALETVTIAFASEVRR